MNDNKFSVILTVDTEGHRGDDPVGKLILGQTAEGEFGIAKIMDVCDTYNVKALFFLDFAEAWDYGCDKIKEVVKLILKRGHDIGVHIHPDHMLDKDRAFLWQYSEPEQRIMIEKCTQLYKNLVGKSPISFRAGKYSANRTTLDILNDLGYRYDFSQFYHQKWCKIDPPITVNAPCKYKNLTEFPVTMHRSVHLMGIFREDKIDIEQMLPGELQYAFSQVEIQDFPVTVTLFLHSFSLLDWVNNPSEPKLDPIKLDKFEKAIAFVSGSQSLSFIKEDELDLVPILSEKDALNTEIHWKSLSRGIYYTYQKAKRISRRNNKAKAVVTAVRIFAILLFISLVLLLANVFIG